MFSGNLSKISLAEVLRLLVMSGQTGALVLEQENFSGMIFLQLGQIIHAAASPYEGIDALNELTKYRKADFSFSDGFPASSVTLADYPAERLIERLKKTIDELKACELAMPHPDERPLFQPGSQMRGLAAKSEELSLLLLADGTMTAAEIALKEGRDLSEVLTILGKFRHAGVIEVLPAQPSKITPVRPLIPPGPASMLPEAASSSEQSAPGAPAAGNPVQYWRGKRID